MQTQIPTMQQLLSAGVHFGHQVRRGHPRMKEYIFGEREGVHILDLEKSEQKLKEAAQMAFELGQGGKVLLVIGTKKQAKEIVKQLATEAHTPYLNERWMGGLLTNFEEIRKNIKKLLELKTQKEKGQLSMYTKKEQLLIARKLEKFERELGGVADMDKVPDALFVLDGISNLTALKEAGRMNQIIIGLSDTNVNPDLFTHPIPSNDDGIKSLKLIAETVVRSYAEGKKDLKAKNEKLAEQAEKTLEVSDKLNEKVAEEAALIEEEIERKVVDESERKV